jgi:hypothetical protein
LHDDRTGANLPAEHEITDLDFDHVTAAELAVDRQIKERAVAQPSVLVEEETDGPDLSRLQRSLGSDLPPRVPGVTARVDGVELGRSHFRSPAATMAKGKTGGDHGAARQLATIPSCSGQF